MPDAKGLTVGKLISQLAAFPMDMPVVMEDGHDWFRYIKCLVGPTFAYDDEGWTPAYTNYSVPTLMLGRAFDTRDL